MGRNPAIEPEDRFTLLAGVGICCLIVIVVLKAGLNPFTVEPYIGSAFIYTLAWLIVLGARTTKSLAIARPDSPILYLRNRIIDRTVWPNITRALIYTAVLSCFGTLFSFAKRSIPLLNDYTWDSVFIATDRAIFGQDAWLFLQPVLGHPLITWILAGFYHAWVLLIYIGNFYVIFFERDARRRARFVLSYVLCWTIVGIVAAISFASVGPCFLEPILGRNDFAAQMGYLHSVNDQYPIGVLRVQQKLLDWYNENALTLGAGISAMPSMHVSQALLIFLAMRKKHRLLGIFFGLFAFLILIGSVHLAYHYAVDGFVAIILTTLIWLATGALFRRMDFRKERSEPRLSEAAAP